MSRAGYSHAEVVLDAVHSTRSAAHSPIAASWCRSALHHRLDPAQATRRERISSSDLARVREANAELLDVARPVLDHVYRAVGRAGCGVVFAEAHGVVLERRIGDADARGFSEAGLADGARWSEAEEGTNGIGTCLFEGNPVTIQREQHFANHNIGISCMDAPVYDPFGRLIAALDVSSCRDDHSPAMSEMISAVVRDAARRIERDYFCRHFSDSRIILLADDLASGMVLLAADRDDLVIGASRAARNRLGLDDANLRAPRPVSEVLGSHDASRFEDGDRVVLRQALARTRGNASEAARLLGIGRATLYRRMARAGLRADMRD